MPPPIGDTGSLWSQITVIEVIIYILVVVVLTVVLMFYIAGAAKMDLSHKSQCYKEVMLPKEHNVYGVTAKVKNVPAYHVNYDTSTKKAQFLCACPPGDVETTFTSIPYYDLQAMTPSNRRVKQKSVLSCSCETPMSGAANETKFSYEGDKGIANFMYDQSSTFFFDQIMRGPNAEFPPSP